MINNITVNTINDVLKKDISVLYKDGPVDSRIMEELAYCKFYFPDVFSQYEQEVLYAMGMFYKTDEPETLFEKSLNVFREEIKSEYGYYYTPDQTLIRKNIKNSLYYSFSAPTSSGKSHVFRDLIKEAVKDIVVIVPSRALISEYYLTIIEMVSKEVLVLTFVDDINKAKTKRRIFILTPERATEIFKYKNIFEIELFLFDEAQITEEKIRGLKFDALVRRAIREFPDSKKVFAHPFIDNPEVHFRKHSIVSNNKLNSFREKTVGQLFYYTDCGHYYLYTPYEKTKRVSAVLQDDSIVSKIIENNGTVLIYLAKSKIYDLRFLTDFEKIISMLPPLENPLALEMIERLRNYLGAGKTNRGKQSLLINLMKQGIVLHHGSIPLKGRVIIEEFIKQGYAKICFATSTLLRGINMPFDLVYIDNFRLLTPLDFKNLIGRAGRTNEDKELNVGCICCDKKDISKIINQIDEVCRLDENNNLDAPIDSFEDDEKDIVEAIKNNEFIDELNIPQIQYDRIASEVSVKETIKDLLDLLMPSGYPITGDEYVALPKEERSRIKKCFSTIFISSLRSKHITSAEARIISTSLHILLWRIQGKTFKETVLLRYNYITNKKEQRELQKEYKQNKITKEYLDRKIQEMTLKFTQEAFSIPNKHKGSFSLFPDKTPIIKCDYDRLVYDTYDYLDKVISLSLVDPINAALEIYYQETKDLRAKALQNYVKFGTNSQFDILLLRYGFDFEDYGWITPCINSITEDGIVFNDQIKNLSEEQLKQIERYI